MVVSESTREIASGYLTCTLLEDELGLTITNEEFYMYRGGGLDTLSENTTGKAFYKNCTETKIPHENQIV